MSDSDKDDGSHPGHIQTDISGFVHRITSLLDFPSYYSMGKEMCQTGGGGAPHSRHFHFYKD